VVQIFLTVVLADQLAISKALTGLANGWLPLSVNQPGLLAGYLYPITSQVYWLATSIR